MSVAIKKSFAPPCDVEWAFTIAPLIKRWISCALPEKSSFDEIGRAASPNLFFPRTPASMELTAINRVASPASNDITEAFNARLELFKKQLAKAKEIKHLDRRIKRVAAVRAQIKALVEAYHATLD